MTETSRNAAVSGLMLVALLACRPLAAAQNGWIADPAIRHRLAAGEVVVQAASGDDPQHPRGSVRAAVLIRATAETVWGVMIDCKEATAYVPGLRRCRRIDGAADGSWADIEHEVRYSWLLPTVDYVFRARYDRPRRIDFHRISGDLKEEEGAWLLLPSPDASATIVEYEVYVDPGFWIPQFLVARSLRKDLPTALAGLRQRAESAGH